MSSLNVRRTTLQAENRSWLRGPHGTEPGSNPNATLLVSLFTAGSHYPNGYIPSGIVLGKVTASGVYGPYDAAATDGRQTAVGFLFGSQTIDGADRVASGILIHGFVNATKLPIQTGTGSLDAAARTSLAGKIYFD
ncbi:head decoration protein [Plantibacter sp. YIM 135249]|uniref:head decoration protein n=1 Tax=Plantibacter sp. YIM 135249 TaxID=3423918 RepID=UPI003D351683